PPTEVRVPPEDLLVAAAVDPVDVRLELGQRALPVREPEPVGALRGQPRGDAEVRYRDLPVLERPVRAVGRLARRGEPGQLRPVVASADVAEVRPEPIVEGAP